MVNELPGDRGADGGANANEGASPLGADWSRWLEIDALLDQALDLPIHDRTAFVANASTDDGVRDAVRKLLAATTEPDTFAATIESETRDAFDALEAEESVTVAGPWRVIRSIGRGGMGSVYLAERIDGAVQQQVALKVLRRGLDTDDVLRRFRDERRILASLRHPHIARLIDAGATADGRPWLAMELIDGVDAETWCREHSATVGQCVHLVQLVARAVDEAHRNLVVHRDIKPSNVLVTADGVPKLLDFGIAKLLADHDRIDATGTALRILTPRYSAPEQRDGGPITTATDVYQLGALLVALATLAPPTPALLKDPSRDSRLRGDLGRILSMALHVDASRRYGTAGAFADDLERWIAGRPVAARPDTFAYRASKFVQRHRWLAPAVVLAMLLGGGWVVSSIRQARVLETERDAAQAQATRAEAVLAFVVDMFRSADPYADRGGGLPANITVVEAMGQGAVRVRAEMDHLPDVQAELLGTITDVLLQLNATASIDTLANDALARIVRAQGDTGVAYAHALNRVGRAQLLMGATAAAETTFRAVIAHRQQSYVSRGEVPDAETANALSHLGTLNFVLGKFADALVQLRRSAQVYSMLNTTSATAQHAADHLRTLAALGNTLVALDSIGTAETVYSSALKVAQRTVGPRHPQVGVAEVNLGRVLSYLGKHDDALTHFERGLEILRQTFGPNASSTMAATNNFANAMAAAGRYDDAAAAHRDIVRIRRVEAGASPSPELAASLQNLAVVEAKRGDTVSAERLHREAAAMYQATGVTGPIPAMPLLSLGGLLLARGAGAEAESVLRIAQARLAKNLPATHVAVVVANCRLARSVTGRVPRAKSIAALRDAVGGLAGLQGAPFRAECAMSLAMELERAGQASAADSVRKSIGESGR